VGDTTYKNVVKERNEIFMEFLKGIIGDDLYAQVETKVNEYNAQNKDVILLY